MNKKILAMIIGNHPMTEKTQNILSGKRNGYDTVIEFEKKKIAYIRVNAVEGEHAPILAMDAYLEQLRSQNKRVKDCTYTDSCLEFVVQLPMRGKKAAELINELTDGATRYLQQNGYETGCALCGSRDASLSLNVIVDMPVICCDQCCMEQEKALCEKQQEFKEKKGNYVAGIVGGLLGSLIGFAVYFGIYQLGYIAVISGIVMSVCVLKGFELFGGKLNIFGAASCLVISVAMAYVANRFSCAYEYKAIVNAAFEVDYSVFDYFRNLKDTLEMFEDGTSFYIENMVYGCGATLFAAIMYCNNAHKEKAFRGEIKRY